MQEGGFALYAAVVEQVLQGGFSRGGNVGGMVVVRSRGGEGERHVVCGMTMLREVGGRGGW